MAARRLAAPAVALILTTIACGLLAAPALAAAPTNINLPAVRGITQDAQNLTEQPGMWTGGSPTSVQWYDCPDASGNGCTPVSAPTTLPSTYTLTDGDVGDYIMVVETATADDGSGDTATANSTPVGPVGPGNTALPSVSVPSASAAPQDGQMLTEVPGTWAPSSASLSVQWEDCPDTTGTGCTPTTTGSAYTLGDNDVGKYIAVVETATANGASTSAASVPVGPVGPSNSSLPSVNGTTRDGQMLSEVPGTWAPSSASLSVQWVDCPDTTGTGCTATATGSTHTLSDGDVGEYIAVVETATANGASTSAASVPVGPVLPGNTSLPSVSGTTQDGQKLAEVPGTWAPSSASLSVQWEDCPDASGTGCTPTTTGSSYTLSDTDVGKYIAVVETATASGVSTQATSVPVGPVGPGNTSLPSVSGVTHDGQKLTEVHGTWAPSSAVLSVQWEDCPDPSGTGCAPTTAGSTYTLSDGDVGSYIMVVETATADGVSTHVSSTPVGPVTVTSTTSLTAAPASPLVTDQVVTLIANIRPQATSAQPSGHVEFMNGGIGITGCVAKPVSNGTAVCQTTFGASPPAPQPQLTAAFTAANGSSVMSSATDPRFPTTLTIGPDATTTTLDVSNTVTTGQTATYSATVAPAPPGQPGPIQPSGSVEFFDGGQPIGGCTNQPVISPAATCTVTYATPGTHTITATYNRDSNFISSTSSSQNITVVSPPAPPPPTPPTGAQTVLGAISATMQWTFNYTPQYTEVLALVLNGAQQTAVTVRCAGRGCPFRNHVIVVGATHPCGKHLRRRCSNALGFNLTQVFRSHHLRVGERITVMITKPSWIGKYYRFIIRSGRGPGVHIGCLAPGATSPGGPC
jgi:hypothetical protein